jgi:hypothetical protein
VEGQEKCWLEGKEVNNFRVAAVDVIGIRGLAYEVHAHAYRN